MSQIAPDPVEVAQSTLDGWVEQRLEVLASGLGDSLVAESDGEQLATHAFEPPSTSPADRLTEIGEERGQEAANGIDLGAVFIVETIDAPQCEEQSPTFPTCGGPAVLQDWQGEVASQEPGQVPASVNDNDGLDPVDLASGEYIETVEDVRIPSLGFDMVVSRSYRSRLYFDGPQGHGWTSPHFQQLRNGTATNGGSILVRLDTAGRFRSYEQEGRFRLDRGRQGDLGYVMPFSGDTVITDATGQMDVFASDGLLRSRVDRAQHRQTYRLRPDGNLVITDTLGREYVMEFEEVAGRKRVVQVRSEGRGMMVEYHYDPYGRLVSAQTPRQPHYPDGTTTTYIYEAPELHRDNTLISPAAARRICQQSCDDACGDIGPDCFAGCNGPCQDDCATAESDCHSECDCALSYDINCDRCGFVCDGEQDDLCEEIANEGAVYCDDLCNESASNGCFDECYGWEYCELICISDVRAACEALCGPVDFVSGCAQSEAGLAECEDGCTDACDAGVTACDHACRSGCNSLGAECYLGCADGCSDTTRCELSCRSECDSDCMRGHEFYGHWRDLSHNLVAIIGPGGPDDRYLENVYGTDPTLPSFDRLIEQRFGEDHYRVTYRTPEDYQDGLVSEWLCSQEGFMVIETRPQTHPEHSKLRCIDANGQVIGLAAADALETSLTAFNYDALGRVVLSTSPLDEQRTSYVWDDGTRRSANLLSVQVREGLQGPVVEQRTVYEPVYNLPVEFYEPRAFVSSLYDTTPTPPDPVRFKTRIVYDHQDGGIFNPSGTNFGLPVLIESPKTVEIRGATHTRTERMQYSAVGQLVSHQLAADNITHFEYYGADVPFGVRGEEVSAGGAGLVGKMWTEDDEGHVLFEDISYDKFGFVLSVDRPGGRGVRYERDRFGRAWATVQFGPDLERRVETEWDSGGRPYLRRRYNFVPPDAINHLPPTTEITYGWNARHQLVRTEVEVDGTPRASVTTYFPTGEVHTSAPADPMSQAVGLGTRVELDGQGRVTRLFDRVDAPDTAWIERYAYDDTDGVSSTVYNRHGGETTTTYDPLFRLPARVQRSDGTETTVRRWPNGAPWLIVTQNGSKTIAATEYKLGEDGLVIAVRTLNLGANDEIQGEESLGGGVDGTGWIERHLHYDDAGRLERVDRANLDGSVTQELSTQYDGLGRPVREEREDGVATVWSYDELGDRIHVQQLSVEAPGWSVEQTTKVDGLGRVTSVRDGAGGETRFGYDQDDQIVMMTDPEGRTTRFVYNEAGELLQTHHPDGTRTVQSYDSLGRLVHLVDEQHQETRWTRDDLARSVTTTYPGGFTVEHRRDARDRLTEIVGSDGRVQNLQYDGVGRVLSLLFTEGPRFVKIGYAYDGLDRSTFARLTDGATTVTTTRTYDTLGHITSERIEGEGGVLGQLGAPLVMEAVYDSVGRPRRLNYEPDHPTPQSVVLTWDERGRLDEANQRIDAPLPQERLIFRQHWDGARPDGRSFGSSVKESRTWDARGSLLAVRVTGPCTPSTTMTCPCSEGFACVDNQCVPTDCATSSSHLLWSETWPRYLSGNVAARVQNASTSQGTYLDVLPDPLANTERYGYDLADRLNAIAFDGSPPSSPFPLQRDVPLDPDVNYTLDDGGNTLAVSLGEVVETTFAYGVDGRLANHGPATVSNTLRGEVTDESNLGLQASWSPLGQLIHLNRQDLQADFVYDGFGRLVASQLAEGLSATPQPTGYAWLGDALLYRRFVERADPCAPELGTCVSPPPPDGIGAIGGSSLGTPTTGDISTTSLGDPSDLGTGAGTGTGTGTGTGGGGGIGLPPTGVPRQIYVYGPGQRPPVWSSVPSEGFNQLGPSLGPGLSLHADLADTVRVVVGGSGSLAGWTSRDPWGSDRGYAGPSPDLGSVGGLVPFGYGGHLEFESLGLVQMRARWYLPDAQRFLSPDPTGYADGTQRFLYARGNPWRWGDPFGLDARPTGATLLVAAGSSGVRSDVGGPLNPRPYYGNPIAGDMARRGFVDLAEILEAGHACSTCHLIVAWDSVLPWHLKNNPSFALPRDQDVDLDRFNRVAVGMNVARDIVADVSTVPFMAMAPDMSAGKAGGTGAARSWTDYLPQARQRLAATKAQFPNSDGVVAMEGKGTLEFGADDLVYGPSAQGKLRALQQQSGGKLLSDIPKPMEFSWVEHSTSTLMTHAKAGRYVRFDLTHASDVSGMIAGTGEYAQTITAYELRFIKQHWATFRGKVFFYRDGVEVGAPW